MRLVRDREKTLRERLKQARLAASLRQVDVAEQLAKPQSYIAKIESGGEENGLHRGAGHLYGPWPRSL
jgi:hypothetical protein